MSRTSLADSVACRVYGLAKNGGDALSVLDGFLARLELGVQRYGALVLASNPRNWDDEADEELSDWAVYKAFQRISVRRQDAHDRFDLSTTEDV